MHDPDAIWASVLAAVPRALAAARGTGRAIHAIGVTNQRETTLLWDRVTGEPVARAIVWQDRRTSDRCTELQRKHGAAIRRTTGLVCDPYFSATKLEWLLQKHPAVRRRAAGGRIAFGTIDSWLVYKLTDGQVHATDTTNASRTLMYNIRKRSWDKDLLEILKVPAQILPEVRDSIADFGVTDEDLFGVSIPIRGIAGDQQAATVGQACLRQGLMKSTYGTGCFALVNTGHGIAASQNRLLSTIAYSFDGKASYALEGSIFLEGATMQWLRGGLDALPGRRAAIDDLAFENNAVARGDRKAVEQGFGFSAAAVQICEDDGAAHDRLLPRKRVNERVGGSRTLSCSVPSPSCGQLTSAQSTA